MDFNSLEELYRYAKVAHEETAINETQEAIKEVESKVIDEVVYSVYEPKKYIRRYQGGGLGDTKNMVVKTVKHGNTIDINLTNETPINPPDDGFVRNYRLDVAVTKGGMMPYYEYGDEGEEYVKPRPFNEKTEERLHITKEHEKAYKNAMKAKGIDIK
ncbi:hypothetical protein [Clostridium botulinum]|uniref:hypothetical protein n=1 Tax=Clostridium botulinum TaxID=1491 RepID=UPI00174CD322|nr:hypothetical protein [Clostridium botulinum]MBD5589195.1 hypothetical protein [Clostridium botulinum]